MLLTLFLLIKKKQHFFGLKPLSPKALKEVIIALGASFIKLAQVLATRSDFFSKEYLEELKGLHDSLPAMSQDSFKRVFEESFAKQNPFSSFHQTPIASASIGQVHEAFLEGEKVAVKLRREGIKEQVLADIRIISFFNALFRPLFSHYTKNSIEAVIREFSLMIADEVSFTKELSNLQSFSKEYADAKVRFPTPFVKYCSDSALVMSFEEGFRFDDKKAILEHNIDFRAIIKKLVNFYTEQMLLKGFFHADPHPGNLLVNTKGELILLDFGMLKRVPTQTRIAIIELIKAANEGDYELYISANKRLGTIAYEAPTSELAEFTSRMFEIFKNDNLDSESMQQLAFEVLASTKDMPFKLPSDAIYILRVSAIIEGLGTTYIENFNGVKDILPILQENMPKALGLKESLTETVFDELKELPFFWRDAKASVKKLHEGSIEVQLSNDQVGFLTKSLKQNVRAYALSFALMFAGFFTLLFDGELKLLALSFFLLGFIRILYK